jgi:uncharacterized protein YecE (DUF72 family)
MRRLENWRKKVPATFEFTLKAWQLITHEASSPTYRRLAEKLSDREKREVGAFRLTAAVMAAWERTLDCAQALSSRIILFQCPARFSSTAENVSNLRAFFREIDRRYPHGRPFTCIWEPRGAWGPSEVRELCDELDLVQGVDPLQQVPVTDRVAYSDFNGRTGYRYRYTEADLKQLLALARAREACYMFFTDVSMWDDAKRFQALVLGL